MHVEKNVCDSLIGVLLDIKGKTKDTLKTRLDLQELGIRPKLHPIHKPNGKHILPASSCTLSKAERTTMCAFFDDFKGPSGFSANIKPLVSMKDWKLSSMKSHECHVMMISLLPVALRGILAPKVWMTVTRLCMFFNAISHKVIETNKLEEIQKDLVETMCELKMYFPPSFFDIMVHLTLHIVQQIKYLGPVLLHQMYPFERLIGVLKRYVQTRSRPEGSIIEGVATEEIIDFCIEYMDLKPIGVPISRHEGRLLGKGTLGRKAIHSPDGQSFRQAHFVVLQQVSAVGSYVSKHMAELRKQNPKR